VLLQVDLKIEGSNGPGLALGPQKSMVFGLIVAKRGWLNEAETAEICWEGLVDLSCSVETLGSRLEYRQD
jgi:hypothetical protein